MSVVAPAGFVAAGGAVGIKAEGVADLAFIGSDDGSPIAAAAVFTANLAAAAPVRVSKAHLSATAGRAAGVVRTSGNANAATGAAGVVAAERLCQLAAHEVGARQSEILICQTGLIGIPFPLAQVEPAVAAVIASRSAEHAAGEQAAQAMLTTDTFHKEALVEAKGFSVGAMAKGAAMLAPNMATMLAVLTTDAACDGATLHELLTAAVGPSFNSLIVDGATTTNDTVIVLARGRAGPVAPRQLGAAMREACGTLAAQMAEDAEGATKVVHVKVVGARTDAEAHRAARQVAGSLLVKCSFNGEDPYWGRVVSELGCAGVAFDPDLVEIAYGGVVVAANGVGVDHDARAVAEHMAGRHIELRCDLGLGAGSGVVLTCDLGYGYLDENRTTS